MPDPILQAAEKTINELGMAPPGSVILVAHSGGPDSTALLHIMARIAPRLGFAVESVHFDHGLREESAQDVAFARGAAAGLGVAFHTMRDPAPPKTQVQGCARDARYEFFLNAAQGRQNARVATGHTLDDSVETSIMWAMRGAGLSAFGGIPPVRGIFIRPLIGLRKSALLKWLERENIPYITDKTNLTDKYLRNRIRRHVIPAMEAASPGAVEALARLASVCGQLGREMEDLAAGAMEEALRRRDENSVTLDPGFVRRVPFAMRGLVYKTAVKRAGGDPSSLLRIHCEAVDKMAMAGVLGRRLNLPEGMTAVLDHGGLTIGKKGEGAAPGPVPFAFPLAVCFGKGELSVKESAVSQAGGLVALSKIPAGAIFRTREPGDYLIPKNFAGRKKLKKYLIEEKVPGSARDAIPLLAAGSQILWIPGLFTAPGIAAGEKDHPVAAVNFSGAKDAAPPLRLG